MPTEDDRALPPPFKSDRYHLVSDLSEGMEHDNQQLQIDARKQLAQCEVREPGATNKLTLIEARRQRCRQARYQRYTKVHELHRGGQTQLEIAENVGIVRRPFLDG